MNSLGRDVTCLFPKAAIIKSTCTNTYTQIMMLHQCPLLFIVCIINIKEQIPGKSNKRVPEKTQEVFLDPY